MIHTLCPTETTEETCHTLKVRFPSVYGLWFNTGAGLQGEKNYLSDIQTSLILHSTETKQALSPLQIAWYYKNPLCISGYTLLLNLS